MSEPGDWTVLLTFSDGHTEEHVIAVDGTGNTYSFTVPPGVVSMRPLWRGSDPDFGYQAEPRPDDKPATYSFTIGGTVHESDRP